LLLQETGSQFQWWRWALSTSGPGFRFPL